MIENLCYTSDHFTKKVCSYVYVHNFARVIKWTTVTELSSLHYRNETNIYLQTVDCVDCLCINLSILLHNLTTTTLTSPVTWVQTSNELLFVDIVWCAFERGKPCICWCILKSVADKSERVSYEKHASFNI